MTPLNVGRRSLAGALTLVCLSLASACQDRLCQDVGLAAGDRYRAFVVERYDEASRFTFDSSHAFSNGANPVSCAGLDGLGAGSSIAVEINGTVENDVQNCRIVTADLLAPPEVKAVDGSAAVLEATAAAAATFEAVVVRGSMEVTVGGCHGGYAVAIYDGKASIGGVATREIFAAPVEGEFPPALLYRMFAAPPGSSCTSCQDTFVVQLAREFTVLL
jgi:hypothetical protein